MAKTGIHIKPCNVRSVEAHNERTQGYIEGVKRSGRSLYFFPELSHLNQSWESPAYQGKTCADIFEELKALYKSKTGQEPQLKDKKRINKKTGKEFTISGWSPIREGVVPIEEGTRLEDFRPVKQWAEVNGLHIIRIDLHHDEGYRDGVTGSMKHNHHAHIVFDWVNHETGKTVKIGADKMSELQDVMATALRMERGEAKAVTGKEHLTVEQFKEKKAVEHVKELKAEVKKLSVAKEGKKMAVEAIRGLLGQGTKDRTIKCLTEQKKALTGQNNALLEENTKLKQDREAWKIAVASQIATEANKKIATAMKREKDLRSSLREATTERDRAKDEVKKLQGRISLWHRTWTGAKEAVNAILTLASDSLRRTFNRDEVVAISTAMGEDNDSATRLALGDELIALAKSQTKNVTAIGRIDSQRQEVQAIAARQWVEQSRRRGQHL